MRWGELAEGPWRAAWLLLIAAGWVAAVALFFSKPGLETLLPYLTAAAALVAVIRRRRSPDPRSEHDRALLRSFDASLPFRPTIQFLSVTPFGGSFPSAPLTPLYQFLEDWRDAAHEFLTRGLERDKRVLMEAIAKFTHLVGYETWSIPGSPGLQTVRGFANEDRALWEERAKRLDEASAEVVRAHQKLVRASRDYGRRPSRLEPAIPLVIAVALAMPFVGLYRHEHVKVAALARTLKAANEKLGALATLMETRRAQPVAVADSSSSSRADMLRWRSEHPVRIACAVSEEPGPWNDSLVVETVGAGVTDVQVESVVFFEARPSVGVKWVDVRYILDGYYGTQLTGDYEGATRRAYGVRGGTSNREVLGALTSAVVDSLSASGFTWGFIEPRRLVRVSYRQLGERAEVYFLMSDQNAEMLRVSRARWGEFKHRADSLRATGRVLRLAGMQRSKVAALVAHECAQALRQ